MDNLSVSTKVLGDNSAKCWDSNGSKVERCIVNKSGILVPVRDDLSRGYESLNEISSSSNHNSKEVSSLLNQSSTSEGFDLYVL